jgi:hypothetical protein
MTDAHKAKSGKRNFCSQREKACTLHGNKYREGDEVEWPKFPRLFRFQEFASWSRGWFPGQRQIVEIDKRPIPENAHHCVCCASVETEIVTNPDIQDVIDQTSWCIHHKDNMMALPLWGHTFIWYVNQMGELIKNRQEPKFVNRPMHDYDHTPAYKKQVDQELADIATKIKKNTKHHKHRVKELKAELNAQVKHFKSECKRRGKREGGTHTAWMKAISDENYKDWYKPFSMADDGDEGELCFPCHEGGGEPLQDKIAAWLEGIWFMQ